MEKKWRDCEVKVAATFQKLGAKTEIQARIVGARGEHDIDVWVTFDKFGVNVRWLVECKFWDSAVPKKKVVALYQIAQDVGADRAFLFSESGFQSGAFKSVLQTNVTLTSLEEFEANAEDEFLSSTLSRLAIDVERFHTRLKRFWIDDRSGRPSPLLGLDMDELVGIDGVVLRFKLAIQQAISGDFPVYFSEFQTFKSIVSVDRKLFLENAVQTTAALKKKMETFEPALVAVSGPKNARIAGFEGAVANLICKGEVCLFTENQADEQHEATCMETLVAMKAIDRMRGALHALEDAAVSSSVEAIIRCLIDTIYLFLTRPTIPRDQWDDAVKGLNALLAELTSLTSSGAHPSEI